MVHQFLCGIVLAAVNFYKTSLVMEVCILTIVV